MLIKLAELKYKIDNNGTITVNLGNGGILKMSPTEILIMANEIVKLQTNQNKMKTAENIYLEMLKILDIPQETIEYVTRKLHGNQKENITQIKEEHKMLYQFVTAFVNEETQENEFEIEEFNVFQNKIEDIPQILENYGFKTELKNKTIKITKNGEHNQNE